MNTSWTNTRKALTNFANMLTCSKCGNKPINATRYSNCGHFFCKQCIGNDSICITCTMPVQPLEICNDHLIKSLVSYCNDIAEIIQEKDLWDTTANSNEVQLPLTTKANSIVSNTKYYVPKKNINKQNTKGETPLHRACLKKQEDYIKALLAAGANPNTKDHNGWTPLQEVVNYGYTNICRLLLDHGASPDIPGNRNRRALHDAAMSDRVLEAELLLKYSASKNVYDDQGKRPIDYCKSSTEMWNLLKEDGLNDVTEEIVNFSRTFNQTFSAIQSPDIIVIYALNLREENKKCLDQMILKHKIKLASVFRSSVTHVIVETNSENIVQLSYDIMMALLHGCWVLNTEWIQLGMDLASVLKGDLELFEVSGAPVKGIPKKARENVQNQNPGLFNHCHFYFALQSKNIYSINDVPLTKDAIKTLVQEGDGIILKREPNPERIKNTEQFIPFHIANELTHPLYRCMHYIIYAPEKDETRVKYNMPHIKSLPLMWLIECIENFRLIDPSELGLLKF